MPVLAALLVSFPILSHLAVLGGMGEGASLGLVGLVTLLIVLRQSHLTRRVLVLLAGLGVGYGLWQIGQGVWAMQALPLFIYGALFLSFASTLRRGQEPLVSRIARAIRGELPPSAARYTRRVTQLWAGYFVLMFFVALGLALWAPLPVWSWFANVLGYGLTAAVFLLEFFVRRRVLRELSHPDLKGYFVQLARCDRTILRGREG
ncbi:MAG: hypothetical protein RBR73_07605 [Halothiobacillaceae bacterium]|jgi:uncharacterized membrane protein|nr:hypothetical protein [Halothiobacillaceae bacterium]